MINKNINIVMLANFRFLFGEKKKNSFCIFHLKNNIYKIIISIIYQPNFMIAKMVDIFFLKQFMII